MNQSSITFEAQILYWPSGRYEFLGHEKSLDQTKLLAVILCWGIEELSQIS